MAPFGVLLDMAHVYMGSIKRAGGLQIQAVPPALVIRDSHGSPLFRHGKQHSTLGEQKENIEARRGTPILSIRNLCDCDRPTAGSHSSIVKCVPRNKPVWPNVG